MSEAQAGGADEPVEPAEPVAAAGVEAGSRTTVLKNGVIEAVRHCSVVDSVHHVVELCRVLLLDVVGMRAWSLLLL